MSATSRSNDAPPSETKIPPLRAGIVGMGKMGRIRAREIDAHPEIELVAACDVVPERLETAPSVTRYAQYQELLEHDLDVLFVCTFNNAAPEITIAGLERGLHVFCEKPPGRSVEDVERIREVEARHPELALKYGFNHRYHYAVLEAKALVDSGRFGKVLWARGVYGKCGGIQFENSWRNQEELAGGGILLDQGIHMLDLCRLFCGDFTGVQSHVSTQFWNVPVEDNAFAILTTDEGAVAMVHSSATQWKHRFSLELCLEGGYVNILGILSSTRSYGDEVLRFARRQFEDEAFAFGKPREESIFFDRDDSWRLELEELVDAIRGRGEIEGGTSEDALKVMELIDAIYRRGRGAE